MTATLTFTLARAFARSLGYQMRRETHENETAVWRTGTAPHGMGTYYAGDWREAANQIAYLARKSGLHSECDIAMAHIEALAGA